MFFINAVFKWPIILRILIVLNLKSSLKGLAINLPAPLGKKRDTSVPLEVILILILKDHLRLKANYNSRLSTDILFKDNKGIFEFQSGQIRLGSAHALNQNKPGTCISWIT